ncbi:unnamed protein product [Nezara viridula]|uniref:Uncharacterized protein n=1 Tax=Nezara viridula TaxID=85310 RepID=A0A9P0H2T8_NEZVI|nr:unnamed protein product [Nezara viridula]
MGDDRKARWLLEARKATSRQAKAYVCRLDRENWRSKRKHHAGDEKDYTGQGPFDKMVRGSYSTLSSTQEIVREEEDQSLLEKINENKT